MICSHGYKIEIGLVESKFAASSYELTSNTQDPIQLRTGLDMHGLADDKTLIYGCSVLSDTIKKAMPELNASYIKCENEKELLKKVLGHIYIAKPTHCIGEFTIPAIKYLNDRAAKLGVNVYDCTEDFNKWFSSYDNPIYSAIAATRPRKPSCPIAEHAAKMFAQRRAYKSMLVTQKKPYSAPIKVLEGSAV